MSSITVALSAPDPWILHFLLAPLYLRNTLNIPISTYMVISFIACHLTQSSLGVLAIRDLLVKRVMILATPITQ
jgi:hypothetical protein